ncbi:MAG: hypothetical protein KA149_00375 [Chitinophagales bacterium]|nr:hypothetical protein [Chitinophagales bacterium]
MGIKERQAFRKERRQKIEELIKLGKGMQDLPLSAKKGDYQQIFKQVWPFLQEAFSFIKLLKVTGPKVDATMDELIKLGNAISTTNDSNAQTQFQEKMMLVWGPLRTLLDIIIAFSPPKVDKVLDKIIEIGDWLTDSKLVENASLTA